MLSVYKVYRMLKVMRRMVKFVQNTESLPRLAIANKMVSFCYKLAWHWKRRYWEWDFKNNVLL